MKFQVLTVGVQKPAEEWSRPGKPEWPDHVTVKLTRRQAITQLAHLAKQLESRGEDESFELNLPGKLEHLP